MNNKYAILFGLLATNALAFSTLPYGRAQALTAVIALAAVPGVVNGAPLAAAAGCKDGTKRSVPDSVLELERRQDGPLSGIKPPTDEDTVARLNDIFGIEGTAQTDEEKAANKEAIQRCADRAPGTDRGVAVDRCIKNQSRRG